MRKSDRRRRLDDIAHVATSLRSAPIDAPDLTQSILNAVDAERAFLAPSVRRRIHISRWALGASVAMVVLGVALTVRWSPEVVQIAGGPAPISNVVKSVESNADVSLSSLRKTVQTVVRTEPERLLSAVAMATRAVEIESPEPPQAVARATGAPVFTGPVLPIAAAMSMEPARPHDDQAVFMFSSRFMARPETSSISTIAAREQQNARIMLDSLSSGTTPSYLYSESDGLPAIR